MKTVDEILAPQNWEFTASKDRLFSSDQVIDAYLKGKNEGLEEQQKLVYEKLLSNIEKSDINTIAILRYLRENSFTPLAAYLKINSWDDFSILIFLHEKEFIDSKMLDMYMYISDMEIKNSEDLFHFQVSFADVKSEINENCVRSDGFLLKHKMVK